MSKTTDPLTVAADAAAAVAAVAAADEQYIANMGEPAADPVPAEVAADGNPSMDELINVVDVDRSVTVEVTG